MKFFSFSLTSHWCGQCQCPRQVLLWRKRNERILHPFPVPSSASSPWKQRWTLTLSQTLVQEGTTVFLRIVFQICMETKKSRIHSCAVHFFLWKFRGFSQRKLHKRIYSSAFCATTSLRTGKISSKNIQNWYYLILHFNKWPFKNRFYRLGQRVAKDKTCSVTILIVVRSI